MAFESLGTITMSYGGYASFTNIPQDGQALYAVMSVRAVSNSRDESCYFYINGDTSNSHYYRRFTGLNDASAENFRNEAPYVGQINGSQSLAGLHSGIRMTLGNYASTTTQKAWQADSGMNSSYGQDNRLRVISGSWNQSNAITSIEFRTNQGFVAGSKVTLYKLTNA